MHKALNAALATVVVAGTTYMVHQANAGQTLTGEHGLPLNPTANGITPGTVEGQVQYFNFGKENGSENGFNNSGGNPSPSPSPSPNALKAGNKVGSKLLPDASPLERYRFSYYGITAAGLVTKNIELSGGITRLRVRGDGEFNNLTKTGINLGVKYLINPDAELGDVHYAVGVGYDRALLKNIRVYGVASKAFRVREGRAPIMGHLGVRFDRFDLDDVDGPHSSKVSVFGGAEVPLTRDGDFTLTGELQSKNSEFDEARIPFSLGLRYAPVSKGFSISAGIQRQGLINDEGFYAQIGYRFR